MKVLWAIDEFILDSRNVTGDLVQAVKDSGHDLFLTKYVPLGDRKDQEYPLWQAERPVILYGTIGWISKSSAPYYPGTYAFGDETNCNVYMTSPLNPYMLNRDFIMLPFGNILQNIGWLEWHFSDTLFIRPNIGKKAFAGTTFHVDNAEYELRCIKELQYVTDEVICLIAGAQTLKAEYRTIVGNGEVLEYSQYRRDDRLDIRHDISQEALQFARMIAKLPYQPAILYTLDVAELPNGDCRIIELNSFNSSGLYAMDKPTVVDRVSDLVTKDFTGEIV